MPFISKVKACISIQRIGYYAARQSMLKSGFSLAEVHEVLAMRLRILGA